MHVTERLIVETWQLNFLKGYSIFFFNFPIPFLVIKGEFLLPFSLPSL